MTIAGSFEVLLIATGVALGLFLLVFWVWMLVDCLTKEPVAEDRLVWTLVICLTQLLGAALYYFLRYRRRDQARLARQRPGLAG